MPILIEDRNSQAIWKSFYFNTTCGNSELFMDWIALPDHHMPTGLAGNPWDIAVVAIGWVHYRDDLSSIHERPYFR
jgi:hypothetical protein